MEYIAIRAIQHFLYCRHRWGLIEIDQSWAENYYVAKANALHERVHNADKFTTRNGKTYTDVEVWNDDIGLYGKLDCLEIRRDGTLTIIEYKPTKPKSYDYNHDDAMQLFAQKLCAEYVFKKPCETYFYFSDVKKRVQVDFEAVKDEYINQLLSIISDMKRYIADGKIPPVEKGQNCSGCSMKDLCLPKAFKTKYDIRKQIAKKVAED